MWSSKITSRNAARIFRFCAWSTLVASVAIGIMVFFPAIVDNRSVLNSLISVFFGLAGLIGSMTSLFLFVGMLTHLLKISGFSTFSKALWTILIVLFLPIGEVIYFFAVYGQMSENPR
jgi:hypothetical protein